MTQAEIIRWAISGIKVKRTAFFEGYLEYKQSKPEVASALMKVLMEMNTKQEELEAMLAKEEEQ